MSESETPVEGTASLMASLSDAVLTIHFSRGTLVALAAADAMRFASFSLAKSADGVAPAGFSGRAAAGGSDVSLPRFLSAVL